MTATPAAAPAMPDDDRPSHDATSHDAPDHDRRDDDAGGEDARLRRRVWADWRKVMERQRWRSTPLGPRRPVSGPATEAAIAAFGLAMRATGLYGRGRRNALAVQQAELEAVCPGLPQEFDGFRILHVTDPHLDLCEGLTESIAEAVSGLPAEICVMTGDYRAACHGPHGEAIERLGRLLPHVDAPGGVWATLGNHDCADMVSSMEALGVGVLVNESLALRRGAASLRMVGLDDVHTYYTPMADDALAAHAPLHDGTFAICLVHSADLAQRAAKLGYGLYLCGHSHGGQICLPGGRPVVTHQDGDRRLARGGWRLGPMQGYTSPGAGTSGVPLRYFCPGEVTRITLRAPRTSGLDSF